MQRLDLDVREWALRLEIARLRRQTFGTSSERGRRLKQLELMLEERVPLTGRANALRNCRRRLQLTIHAVVTAPPTKASKATSPASASRSSPKARWSVIDDSTPVMCDVYCPTARKPPALMAPATKLRLAPSRKLTRADRWLSVHQWG